MTLWTSVSATGYNASPPPDDGSQVASNKVTWSGIKTQLGDPVKTAVDALNTSGAAMGAVALSMGKNTYWIPGLAMAVRTTNGGTQTSNETASNKIMEKSVSFSPTTTQFAQWAIGLPKAYNLGTVTWDLDWLCTSTGNVVWGLQAVGISDGDTFDATFGTAIEVTDNVLSITQKMKTAESSPVTISSIASGDLSVFQLYRNATSTGNTATSAARVLGLRLYFTTNAADDT
jgi:hypothetical protein